MSRRSLLWTLLLASGSAVAADAARYELSFDAATERMSVALCLPNAAANIDFGADDVRFIGTPTRDGGGAVMRDGDGYRAADWRAGECLRYVVELGRMADTHQPEVGWRLGRDVIAAPNVWLLQPDGYETSEAHVTLPQGYALSVPWMGHGEGRYTIPSTPTSWSSTAAIGRFEETRVELPGGALRIAIVGDVDATQRATLQAWFGRVSRAALAAFGRLPASDVQVLMLPIGRSSRPVAFGQSLRGQGHALMLLVDPGAKADALARDWVAVHELSHLFHPYLGDRGAWLAEGLATYWQNVLRARAGLLTPAQAWEEMDAGFGRGRGNSASGTLEEASLGMHSRHDFMRVYWAGTAYWLDVDAELRRASGGKLSVDEALRRFGDCCRPTYRRWEPATFVAKLDSLLGTNVFVRRYDAYRAMREFPPVDSLYRDLGIVRAASGSLRFDDAAPMAPIREAIMHPAPR